MERRTDSYLIINFFVNFSVLTGAIRITLQFFHFTSLSEVFFGFIPLQDDGLPENEHQLSVAGKIKKHFNTGPKPNSTAAGVSVIAVSI